MKFRVCATEKVSGSHGTKFGELAHSGERFNGIEEVTRAKLVFSTNGRNSLSKTPGLITGKSRVPNPLS